MKFNVKDLDLDQLEKDTILEAQEIWKPEGNRPYQNVYDMVSIGKPAENFLKEKAKFTNDIRKWHDLVSPCGHTVEVKVRNPMKISSTLSELSMLRADPKRYLQSDWVFIFTMEGRETYNLHGTYKWSDSMGEYMSEKFNWKAEYEIWTELNEDRKYLDNL